MKTVTIQKKSLIKFGDTLLCISVFVYIAKFTFAGNL